jgi:hypothetical protein
MESKHTPGPWVRGTTSGGALGVWQAGSPADSPEICIVASSPSERDWNNARLLAAAPDLLDALRALLAWSEDAEVKIDGEWGSGRTLGDIAADGDLSDEIANARAAIAKARGETK